MPVTRVTPKFLMSGQSGLTEVIDRPALDATAPLGEGSNDEDQAACAEPAAGCRKTRAVEETP